jgi:hypothetical protein
MTSPDRPSKGPLKLTQEQVAAVVAEASQKMSDPTYSATVVGEVVERQAPVTQYVAAHQAELGSEDAIISVIFYCGLVAQCFTRAGRRPRTLTYEDLDRATHGDPLARLEAAQLPLYELIKANVEGEQAQRLVAVVALAMHGTT